MDARREGDIEDIVLSEVDGLQAKGEGGVRRDQTQLGKASIRWREARRDDPIFANVFMSSINEPPPGIGVAADALATGDYTSLSRA